MIILILFVCPSYPRIDPKISSSTSIENGVKIVKNTDIPLKGTINLKLTPIQIIDPIQYKQINSIFISNAYKDTYGNIYLLDGKNLRIHKFNSSGQYQVSFLSRGSGPGELNQYPYILINQNSLFAYGFNDKKIIRFDLNGKILKEKKFLKFYNDPIIIDDKQFIASEDLELTESPSKRIGLYSLEPEKLKQIFMETKERGRIFIPFGKSRVAVEPEVGIIPDMLVKVDISTKKCFIALNNEYKIYLKDFSGNTEMIIEKSFQPIELTTADKDSVISDFGDVPTEIKTMLHKVFPNAMCAFRGIDILSGEYLAVERFIDYNKCVLDIFDKNGRFLYVFQPPDILKLKASKIFKDKFMAILEEDNNDIYIEYKIDNFPNEMYQIN